MKCIRVDDGDSKESQSRGKKKLLARGSRRWKRKCGCEIEAREVDENSEVVCLVTGRNGVEERKA